MALQSQLSDLKTAEWLSRGLGSIVYPRLCWSISVCPPLGEWCQRCCLLAPSPAAAPLRGTASRASKGLCTNPALPGELPRPKREVWVFSLLPLSPAVWLCLWTAVRPRKVTLEKRRCTPRPGPMLSMPKQVLKMNLSPRPYTRKDANTCT